MPTVRGSDPHRLQCQGALAHVSSNSISGDTWYGATNPTQEREALGVPHSRHPAGKAGENGQRSASSGRGTWLRPSVTTGAKALFRGGDLARVIQRGRSLLGVW